MSKIPGKAIILLLFVNFILQVYTDFLVARRFQEIIFIPIRPQLTRVDLEEALIIKNDLSAAKNVPHEYDRNSPSQITAGLDLLRKDKAQLLSKAQISKILPHVKKIYSYKKRIGYLKDKVKNAKCESQLSAIRMCKALRFNQLNFCISDIDLFTLKTYEFPYWRELLHRLNIKANGAKINPAIGNPGLEGLGDERGFFERG